MKAQRRILLALVALFSLLFAACGGDDDSGDDDVASIDEDSAGDSADEDDGDSGGNGDPPTEQEFQDAFLEYAQCMRDHGVEMEDPTFEDGGGVMIGGGPDNLDDPASQEEFEEADTACSPIIEEVAPREQLSPEEQAELQDQMLEVAQCMRDKGHDMPDPEVGEDGSVTVRAEAAEGGGGDEPGGANGPSEEFQNDMRDCEDEAGVERGRGGEDEEEEDS